MWNYLPCPIPNGQKQFCSWVITFVRGRIAAEMKSVASHSSFLDLCQQHFLQVTVKTQKKHKHNIISSPAHTHPISNKNGNYWEWSTFSLGHCPKRAFNCGLNQCFGPFKKVDQLPTMVREVIWPIPHTLFSGTLPYYKTCGHTKTKKHKQANKSSFRLRHNKKSCNLKNCLHSMILPQLDHIFFSLPLDLHGTSCCDFSKPPLLRNCNCTGHTRSHQS